MKITIKSDKGEYLNANIHFFIDGIYSKTVTTQNGIYDGPINGDSFKITHIGFEEKNISLYSLGADSTIILKSKTYIIPPVTIRPKKENNKKYMGFGILAILLLLFSTKN